MTRGRRARWRPGACAIAGLAAALAGCRTSGPWEAFGPDHRTPVSVATRHGRQCVSVGERLEGCYDGVSLPTLAFGGRQLAYAVQVGPRWAIVHGGEAGRAWDGVGPPRLSPDGARVAYPALETDRWRVVVDGVPGEAFDGVLAGTLQFDPTGGRVAFAATRQGRAWVVVDGVVSGPWAEVGDLQFDSTGAHVAYRARDASGTSVVIDGWVGPPHALVGELVLGGTREPTPGWEAPARCAYAAAETGPWRVRVDGAAGPAFDGVRGLVLLPGDGVAYVAQRDGREALVRGARVGDWHDGVTAAAFAPDGRWGYVAQEAEVARVVVDGRVVAEAPWATDLAFGAGERSAYVVGDGDDASVIDESGRHPFDLVVAGSLLYVAGGRTWACLAGDRRRHELYVVADGVRVGRPFDWSELVRQARNGGDATAIRTWVAAEAERALTEGPTAPAR